MFLSGIKQILRSVPASLIACAVFLLPVENAFAAADITLSTFFAPVDSARNSPAVFPPYMDRAGTWNGSIDATDISGDRFTLRVQNIGSDALSIEIGVDVPNGFRLPYDNFPLTVTSPATLATPVSCNTTSSNTRFTGITVSQFGNRINFNIPNNRNIPANCTYDFRIGLTTDYQVSTATVGTNNIDYDFFYDDNAATGYLEEITHQVEVYGTNLTLEKTATNPSAVVDGNPVSFDITITNTGTVGTNGGLFDLEFTDFIGSNLSGIQIYDVPVLYTDPPNSVPTFNQNFFTFKGYFSPGASVSFKVDSTVNVPPDDTSCSIMNSGVVQDRAGQVSGSGSDSIPYDLSNVLTLTHDPSSYCLLCGEGEVILTVANTGGITLNDVTVTDTISAASGLEYVPGSATFTIIGGGFFTPPAPTELSTNPTTTPEWNIGSLDSPLDISNSNPVVVEIRFRVRRIIPAFPASRQDEGLAASTLVRTVQANATYTSICGNSSNPLDITSGTDTLLLQQPEPVVTKLGWNVDAAQTETTAAAFVYGHEDDDIIWRIDVRNNGAANLEDLLVKEDIEGNFAFTAVCTVAADATTMSGGPLSAAPPALPYNSCVARAPDGTPSFLPPPNPGIDVTAANNGYVYYVGKILADCSNANNDATIQWGCDGDNTPGGIGSVGDGTALVQSSIADANVTGRAGLNTAVGGLNGADLPGAASNTLDVGVQITGTHPSNFGATGQPAGSRGRVTITITNNTGGTVRDITFDNVLPTDYVVDPSINNASPNVNPATTATNNPAFDIVVTPANGVASYRGMVDTVEWMAPNGDPLLNTAPRFELRSSVPGAGAFQDNLLRHGDQVVISFDIVLINAARYDLEADLDPLGLPPRDETNPIDPDNGENASIAFPPGAGGPGFRIDNSLTVDYFEACAVSDTLQEVRNDSFRAFPEDLDVDISGAELSFILNTDSAINLPLTVEVTNNGGHDARNYFLLVTFGNAMEVDPVVAITTTPGGGVCTLIPGSPPTLPRPFWNDPEPIPVGGSPSIYQCDLGVITPGAQIDINFEVQRNASSTVDDLTFRVDVVGEIQLSDGTALTFPPVATTPGTQIDNVANNYSLDAIRARVIGFGLLKNIAGDCTEQASFPARTTDAVFIGEDCKFNILSGGWFGFETPGFGIIAVHTIEVFDELPTAATPVNPSAQGFISQTNGAASDLEIFNSGITFYPVGITQLDQGTVSWTFNVPNGGPLYNDNKLYNKDKLFRTNITSRLLNDEIDPADPTAATPNRHNVLSRNILNTTFSADFSGGVYSFGPGTAGYPAENLRRYDLTITEPNIEVRKTVCNETLAGGLGSCGPGDFKQSIPGTDDGDTEDLYVYRIEIENLDDSASTGITRAPAYNMVVVDTLDSSDLMQLYPAVDPFDNDNLDNDGDEPAPFLVPPDEGGEAVILTDNVVNDSGNINPAKIKFSYTSSEALKQIDPGEIVRLYYRVNPDDFIAPLQTLTNTVDVKYDSLDGLHGNQNPVAFDTDPDQFPDTNPNPVGTIGSARIYTDLASDNILQHADVQITSLSVVPKIIVQTTTQTGAGPLPTSTEVVVGEEIEYKLRTLIPIANLREFKVRDELPPGLSCADVPEVDLTATGPHVAAGFNPGGKFNIGTGITCTDNLVEWNFGDQELTGALDTRYPFEINFIARVENTDLTNVTPFNPGVNNCVLRNGGAVVTNPAPAQTCAQDTFVLTSYRNDPTQGSDLIEHFFGPIEVVITEPQLQVTKTFIAAASGNPGTEETAGDSKDIFDVRVDVINTGDAVAYNPQILDNLLTTKYTYLGNIGGNDPPTSDGGITLPAIPAPSGLPGTNQPVFSWPAAFTIPDAGGTISFIYRVQANDDLLPLEDVENTIDAKWTSLKDNTESLNSSGSIGADGAVDGMRIGYLPGIDTIPVPAKPQNDYVFNHSDSIVVPGLTITKTDLDLAADNTDTQRTIGEHRRFQIDIDLPEGITTTVRIDDNLAFADVPPAPVQTYMLENLAPYEVQYEFFGISSINGTAPTPANAETIFTAVPVDETQNLATWDIGSVVTDAEDDSPLNATPVINPRIRITYFARLNNDLATNSGDDLANEVTLQYTSGQVPPTLETEVSNTADVRVKEPDLIVTKIADVTTADAGDVIQYTITVNHDPDPLKADIQSSAFDLNIQDNIPASVVFNAGSASITIDGVAQGNVVPLNSVTGPLVWGRTNTTAPTPGGDDQLDILFDQLTSTGQELVITYTVTVQNTVQPVQAINNGVVVDWTSLNGDIAGLERTGTGGVDCAASVAPDDYCVGPAIATVNIVDANTIVKTKTNDSFNLTAAGTDVRIGDIIEYTLTLTLQEGTTRGVTLVDTLPNGLEFVDIVSVNDDIAAPYSSANGFIHAPITAPVATPTGAGNNVLSWAIGDATTGIINSANDGNNDFIIIYRAVVTKNEFTLPQVATTAISNTVVLDYLDVNDAQTSATSSPPLSRLTSTVNLDAQQPIIFLSDLTKTRRTPDVSGEAVVPFETMEFRLSACNTNGTAPAYNLVLQDILPQYDAVAGSPLLDFSKLSVPEVRINGVLVTDTVDYDYTPPSVAGVTTPTGTMQIAFKDSGVIPAGQCTTVEFDIDVHELVGSQLDWNNILQLTEYHSLPSVDANADVTLRQTYGPQGPVFFNMNTVLPVNDPEKALLNSPAAREATIGQEISYQIKVPGDGVEPMKVNMFNVLVTDQLVDNVTFVGAVLDASSQFGGVFSTSVSPTNELTISIPKIDYNPALLPPGTEQAVFNVTVRVNNDTNTSSLVAPLTPAFGNSVEYSFTGPSGNGLIESGIGATPGADDISIVEPQLDLFSKTVANLTQADADTDAGDVLRYTLVINSSNGLVFSDAFDLDIIDQLSPGLEFCSVADGGLCEDPLTNNTITGDSITGTDRIASTPTSFTGSGLIGDGYILNWNSVNASATNIDIPENSTTTITYTVKVMDEVLANQQLNNAATIRWTSLDGVSAFERDGTSNTAADRRYIDGPVSSPTLTVPIVNNLTKTFASSTSTLGGTDVRIGDVVDYKLTIQLQEGTSQNVELVDTLPQGLQYEGIVSVLIKDINGFDVVDNDGSFESIAPFPIRFSAFNQTAASVLGNPLTGPTTVTISLGDVVNTGNNDPADDTLILVYRTRVLDLVQTPLDNPNSNIDLQNAADLKYGRSPVGTTSTDPDITDNTVPINIDQPNLTVAKQFVPVAQDTVIEADEVLNFSLEINNTTGQSPAYDLVIQDILPNGLRDTAPFITSIVKGGVTLPNTLRPVQTYNPVTGEILWDFDTGTADELTIQIGEIMTVNYQVVADSDIGAGLSMDNQARALRYYSFDDDQVPQPVNVTTGAAADTQIVPPEVDDREEYGPGITSTVNLTSDSPGALSKTEQADTDISIGEIFSYIITVPQPPVPPATTLPDIALHDVRITDNLAASGVDLIFVNAEAVDAAGNADPTATYTPVNTSGNSASLVIEDVTNGIEVPAGESIYIKISVIMRNNSTLNNGWPLPAVTFTNEADYTFNSVDNDDTSRANGSPGVSGVLTIVEPNLTIAKTGPSVPDNIVYFNTPIPYTLVVENTGTAPAYDTTITDIFPQADASPLTGGTCNTAPDPANIHAQVFTNTNVAIIGRPELVQGVDYTVSWAPSPDCELVITTLTTAAVIEKEQRLIITYEAFLDVNSMNGALLTNTAIVSQYFSQDTPAGLRVGEIRDYPKPLIPFETDTYTVEVAAAELVITKVATDNLTAGGSGAFADPGDRLHYTIAIFNIGPAPTGLFSFTDQPDRLNPAPGYFDFASLGDVLLDGVAVPYTATGGVLSIPNLNLDEGGGVKDNLTIEFNINLIPVITAGLTVLNQGEANLTGFSAIPTDDPSIGGLTDPTETLIDAAPAFQITKRSADITGEANILRQGDTLRYTLQVKNIGLENVTNAYLRDLIPANTHYVLNTTRLNGVAVADVNGTSALENEMLINAPENTTPGFMRADASAAVTSNVATITFDVMVDADVIDGTVISNQGYVGGLGSGSGPFAEQASNDPDTTLANDPTINVVGNLPTLNAQKTVRLFTDVAGNGFVDNNDVLEYQIVVANGGAVAATQVSLIDPIPGNSSYVANSVSLNGSALLDADLVSISPLTVRLNSSDLGLPNQAANDGQITPGNEAILTFRVQASGVASDRISNQGSIISSQLPDQLTDADGNSGNGAQPTDIYIGANSKLEITKEVYVVGGGVALAGGTLEYVIQVQNTGLVDASSIELVDHLSGLDAVAIVSYVTGSTRLDGSDTYTTGGTVVEPVGAVSDLLVHYAAAKGVLEPGEKFTVSYRVVTNSDLAAGTEILNTATVNWTESATSVTDTASIEIGGAPGVGVLGGTVWHDIIRSPIGEFTTNNDLNLQDWIVRIYLNNPSLTLFAETITDENGAYQFKGLPPSLNGGEYELRFIPPGGSDTSASMGPGDVDPRGIAAGIAGEMRITDITVNQGVNIAQENMPVIPTGVVYDAIRRTPVTAATLSLVYNDGTNFVPVPNSCLPANSNQHTQLTSANGFYRFDIQPQAAGCTVTDFVIQIDSVPVNYVAGTSEIIPPGKAGNVQLDVPACSADSSDDTIAGNGDCDVQFAATPPGVDVAVRTDSTEATAANATQGTSYFLNKTVTTNGQVAFNNHIPLDPELSTIVSISKVSSMLNVTRSQLVPYTITLRNNFSAPLTNMNIEDQFPAGFKYVTGSGRIQIGTGAYIKTEPLHDTDSLMLTWQELATIGANTSVKIKLLLVVGSGVGEGEYVNRARARNSLNRSVTADALATVRVVPDPTFDCSDVIGKVFDDKNLNAYQDEGEKGLAGVRVLTARGLEITTDAYGRFHVTCAVVPNPDRGSNFILKLDERSLPTGYRLTTENPRVVRATRGKMVKFNFGAAIHRVVRLDMANEVFEPGTTTMRPQWLPRLDILISELAKDPSLLRLSYLADNESTGEVNDRLNVVKDEIQKRWETLNCCYQLTIETEVLWRKGGPPDRGGFND